MLEAKIAIAKRDVADAKKAGLDEWRAGQLGTRLRSWKYLPSESEYNGLFSIRCEIPGQIGTCFNIERDKANLRRYKLAESTGIPFEKFYFSEMAPDEKLKLQGEVCIHPYDGLSLCYNTKPVDMRRGLSLEYGVKHAIRIEADAILREYLDPPDYDDLMDILNRKPGCAVEFSAYRCSVGDIPGRRCLFWEAREC